MAVTDTKNTNIKQFFFRTLTDPVLIYAVIVMMSMMYHYRSKLAFAYGIVTFVVGWLIFRIFDFINKHNIIGFFMYIILFMGVSWTADRCIDIGQKDYPIGWGLWFLTPQDSLEYNAWYTHAVYLLFLIFMLSVIYYFTYVRYRILMNFVIFIIPFAIYGKEYEKMPTMYIILMAVGYVFLMVYFRQLKDGKTAFIVEKPESWKSTAVYIVVFALVASVVPKPEVEADREILETLINADAFTDRLVEMLNVFRDTAGGEQFRGNTSNTPVYYVDSPEPLRLKTGTFTDYHFENDTWTIGEYDKEYQFKQDSVPLDIYGNGNVSEAVLLASRLDSDFAKKYGIDPDTQLKIPADSDVTIYTAGQGGQFAPVPQFAKKLEKVNYNDYIALVKSGLVFADGGRFGNGVNFTFSYTPDVFFYNSANKAFAESLEIENYAELLSDTKEVLGNAINSSLYMDSENIPDLYAEISFNNSYYSGYVENLLDYGNNQRIRHLAEEVTSGAVSDFDKAKKLESYFYVNNYTYDLGYQKARGDNAETFLFESKTGVCYEYATSMVLMARSVGIPARYCEGFNMQREFENGGWKGYMVSSQDAHGFPELYIRGYGWMSFEPTVTDGMSQQETTTTENLSRAGIIIFLIAVAVLILVIISPKLYHKAFISINSRKNPDDAVKAVMHRICRIYGINKANTSHEAEKTVKNISGADISETAEMFDRMAYGNQSLDENCRNKAIENYVSAYNALIEKKKQERKERRKRIKNIKK